MNHIQVYVEKDQNDEVLENHPNLTSSVDLLIYDFDTPKDFRTATDKQIEKFVESRLEDKAWVNTDYGISEEEEVKVVQNYNKKTPVFKGKVKIPDKIVKISEKHSGKGRIEIR